MGVSVHGSVSWILFTCIRNAAALGQASTGLQCDLACSKIPSLCLIINANPGEIKSVLKLCSVVVHTSRQSRLLL